MKNGVHILIMYLKYDKDNLNKKIKLKSNNFKNLSICKYIYNKFLINKPRSVMIRLVMPKF